MLKSMLTIRDVVTNSKTLILTKEIGRHSERCISHMALQSVIVILQGVHHTLLVFNLVTVEDCGGDNGTRGLRRRKLRHHTSGIVVEDNHIYSGIFGGLPLL